MAQGGTTTRPPVWEDEAPAEPRFRRVQQGVPPSGRALPGMPVEMQDPDDGARTGWGRSAKAHYGEPSGRWWRPASSVGRAFLTLGALIVLGGLATSGYLLKTYLERDARFRIAGASNIEATGLTEVSRAELLPVFGEDIGRNIFFVPLNERRKQLEELPWVERATVMRLLPDQIRVSVVERKPVAFTRQGQQIGLVDANGVLLSMPPAMMAQQHYSFPVVTGLDSADSLASRKGRMDVYLRLLAELDANNQHVSNDISEIDLTDPEDARVLMPEQGADVLAHFGEDHFMERYQRYKAHIAEWRQQYPKLSAVDLRYNQQVVLEMTPGTSAAPAAGNGDATAGTDASKPAAPEQAEVAPPAPKPASGKSATEKSASGKPATGKTAAKSANVKAGVKPGASAAEKAKAAKAKAIQDDKKRAEAKRIALNASKRKPAPTTRPAVAVAEGQ